MTRAGSIGPPTRAGSIKPPTRAKSIGPTRHWLQLVLALAAVAGAAVCWPRISSLVDVAPVTDGQPATVSVVYHAPVMLLVWILATAAGVLAVLGVAGLRRRRSLDAYTP